MMRRHRRLTCLTATALAVSAMVAPLAHAAPTADTSFGSSGVVALDLPGADYPTAMVATVLGELAITIQSGPRLWIAMLHADGRLNTGFAGTGVRKLRPAADTRAFGLQPTRDGGVLVAAWLRDDPAAPVGDQRIAIIKLRTDGHLDGAYGRHGLATTAVGELTPTDLAPNGFAMQPDGAAIVAGVAGAASYFAAAGAIALIRFRPDGTRDTTFGVHGLAPVVNDAPYPVIAGMTAARDGDIVLAEMNITAGPFREELVLRRFDPTGTPDIDFGVAGIAHLAVPGDWKAITDVAIDDRGRIVCLGFAAGGLTGALAGQLEPSGPEDPSGGYSPVIARVHGDGRPDTSFGRGGLTMLHRDAHGNALSWSGDLALSGSLAYVTLYEESASQLATELLRIGDRGQLDTTYGGAQPVWLPMQNTFAVGVIPERTVVAGERTWNNGGTIIAASRP